MQEAVNRQKDKSYVSPVGHSLLVTSYYLITKHLTYQDLGANYLDEHRRERVKRRAMQRLENLGFQVQLRFVAIPTVYKPIFKRG